MYAQHTTIATVLATNPEGCVSAGSAKIPAPTVVPATRNTAPDMEPLSRAKEDAVPSRFDHRRGCSESSSFSTSSVAFASVSASPRVAAVAPPCRERAAPPITVSIHPQLPRVLGVAKGGGVWRMRRVEPRGWVGQTGCARAATALRIPSSEHFQEGGDRQVPAEPSLDLPRAHNPLTV